MLVDSAPFVVGHLFYPEAGCGRIQQAEQTQVIILAQILRQNDCGRMAVKNKAAAIKNEMVMSRDKGKDDSKSCFIPMSYPTNPSPPGHPIFRYRSTADQDPQTKGHFVLP